MCLSALKVSCTYPLYLGRHSRSEMPAGPVTEEKLHLASSK